MPQVTLDIPQENIALFMEITHAMAIRDKDIVLKEESPDWHLQVLELRLDSYKLGKSKPTSWDEFEKELDKEDFENEL